MARFFAALFAFLGRVLVASLGRWDPPGWPRWLGRQGRRAGGWALAPKRKSGLVLAAVAVVGAGGGYGWHWWKTRPKPTTVSFRVFEPGLTAIGDKVTPRSLVVRFSASVAPLRAVGTVVRKGISVDPKLDGTWKWSSDRELELRPREDWPVGQTFSVRFERKGLAASHVTLDKYGFEFSTPPFTVQLREAEFYQDPVDPNLKKVVSEWSFSHPVDGPSFEKSIAMRFVPTNKEERDFPLAAHVTYDKWKARAFVHSDPFALPQKDAVVELRAGPGSKAARGGPAFTTRLESNVRVPGVYNFFRVNSARVEIVDNPRLEPEQILVMQLSAAATEKEITKAFELWLLPTQNPHDSRAGIRRPSKPWARAIRASSWSRIWGSCPRSRPMAVTMSSCSRSRTASRYPAPVCRSSAATACPCSAKPPTGKGTRACPRCASCARRRRQSCSWFPWGGTRPFCPTAATIACST